MRVARGPWRLVAGIAAAATVGLGGTAISAPHDGTMTETAKGYWIGTADVTDLESMKRYRAANREVMARYGAKFIIRHGRQRIVEGKSRSIQTVVEFPSYAAAVAAYDDPAYRKALKFRHAASRGELVIVEGYVGRQNF